MRRLLLCLFVFVGLALKRFGAEAYAAVDLHVRWAINFPTVSLVPESNTIIVDYGISDELTPDNVRTKIMTEDCEGPQITQGILSDFVDPINGAQIFRLDIGNLINNETISTIGSLGDTATMSFCLRYALWTGDEEDSSSIEINYLLNHLTVYLRADGEFVLDAFNVNDADPSDDDDDRNEKFETERHILQCFLCHPTTHFPIPPPPNGFGMGDVVSICSAASQSVIDDNIILKGVDYFLWRRTFVYGGLTRVTEQWAVKDGIPDPLSTYNCPPDALLCTFTTMLNAEFFASAGSVEGIGSTTLEFGSGSSRKLELRMMDYEQALASTSTSTTSTSRRRTQGQEPARELQEEEEEEDVDANGSNMAMWIPVRGPDVRPRLREPIQEKENISTWLLWLLMALIFLIIFALSAYLYWREWQREEEQRKSKTIRMRTQSFSMKPQIE